MARNAVEEFNQQFPGAFFGQAQEENLPVIQENMGLQVPGFVGNPPPGKRWVQDGGGGWVLVGDDPGQDQHFVGQEMGPDGMSPASVWNFGPGAWMDPIGQGQFAQNMIDDVGLGGQFGIWDYWLMHNARIEQARKDREMKMWMLEQLLSSNIFNPQSGAGMVNLDDISVYNTQGGGAASTREGGPMANAIAGTVPEKREVRHLGDIIADETGGPGWSPRSLDESIMSKSADMPFTDAFKSVDAQRRSADAPYYAKAERGALDDITTARAEADLGSGDWIAKTRSNQLALAEEQARQDELARQQRLSTGLNLAGQITGGSLGSYQNLLTG